MKKKCVGHVPTLGFGQYQTLHIGHNQSPLSYEIGRNCKPLALLI